MTEVQVFLGNFTLVNLEGQKPILDQTDDFVKVMASLSNQTALTNLVIGRHDLNDKLNTESLAEGISHVRETLSHFGLFLDFGLLGGFAERQPTEDLSPVCHQLANVPNLKSLHLSGTMDIDLSLIFENCELTALQLDVDLIGGLLKHMSKGNGL